MGRKKGFDERKIGKIISILLANPEGVWLRKIAKDAGYSPATVAHYIEGVLAPLIQETSLGSGKPLLRVISLKPYAAERLQEGRDLRQVMKILKLMNKIQ